MRESVRQSSTTSTVLPAKPTRGGYGSPSSTNQDAVLGGALWKTLGAVKSGQARPVSDETWFLGLGVMAANAVLSDLKGFVAPGS
ncbi:MULTISPECIES: hypothetical protein [Streptomyces]|uniref:hypothetical protein n=1 Tax=Streptomyces TaxID=1883 RepID=UPI0004AA16F7|nr:MULTISPECIES: hypothetical protein [Streptomyces]